MAVEFKKLQDQINNAPLTEQEIAIIDDVENYIDKEITTKFKGYDINIDLNIAHFNYNPITHKSLNLAQARQKLMIKELNKRYSAAGWKTSVLYDDGLDGPNMSGPDLWVLSGKRK